MEAVRHTTLQVFQTYSDKHRSPWRWPRDAAPDVPNTLRPGRHRAKFARPRPNFVPSRTCFADLGQHLVELSQHVAELAPPFVPSRHRFGRGRPNFGSTRGRAWPHSVQARSEPPRIWSIRGQLRPTSPRFGRRRALFPEAHPRRSRGLRFLCSLGILEVGLQGVGGALREVRRRGGRQGPSTSVASRKSALAEHQALRDHSCIWRHAYSLSLLLSLTTLLAPACISIATERRQGGSDALLGRRASFAGCREQRRQVGWHMRASCQGFVVGG